MEPRPDITKKQGPTYTRASKKRKGEILVLVKPEKGWPQANSQRQLTAEANRLVMPRKILG